MTNYRVRMSVGGSGAGWPTNGPPSLDAFPGHDGYRLRSKNPCISRCGSSVRNDCPNTPTLKLTDSVSGSSSHCRNSAFWDRRASGPHSSSALTVCSTAASRPPCGARQLHGCLAEVLKRGSDRPLEGGDIAELVGEHQRQPGEEQDFARLTGG